jgi:hypothetical protein
MGTRNLTIIKIDGEIKCAQYGQWDGYPSGQGKVIADFFKNFQCSYDLDIFKTKVRKLRWLTTEEHDEILKNYTDESGHWMTIEQGNKLLEDYPYLSRDTGAKILWCIAYGNIKGLVNSIDFLDDDVFCEWAYEIDLDKDKITVYRNGKNIWKEYVLYSFTSKEMDKLQKKSQEKYNEVEQ